MSTPLNFKDNLTNLFFNFNGSTSTNVRNDFVTFFNFEIFLLFFKQNHILGKHSVKVLLLNKAIFM